MSKKEILKEFEELIPEMQISTRVEPRLLNADMVKRFISQSLDRIEDETRKQVVEEFEKAFCKDNATFMYKENGRVMSASMKDIFDELKSKYGIQETEENKS